MKLSETPLINAATLHAGIQSLAAEISIAYSDTAFIMLTVLKGALHFSSDLQRALNPALDITSEFIRVRSYEGTESNSRAQILYKPENSFAHKHVLIIEDILDTGHTASVVQNYVANQKPASIRFCTLLDKPDRRLVPVHADFTGFTIDDHFVVGYGLDYNEQYRHLPEIYTLF